MPFIQYFFVVNKNIQSLSMSLRWYKLVFDLANKIWLSVSSSMWSQLRQLAVRTNMNDSTNCLLSLIPIKSRIF